MAWTKAMNAVKEAVIKIGAARYCAKITVDMNALARPPTPSSHIIMRLFAVGMALSMSMTSVSRGAIGVTAVSSAIRTSAMAGMMASLLS